jgi:hypothetical protein
MKTQPLKVFFCNVFLIVLLVAPVLAIAGTLVGLGLFAFADYPQTARWICGISFGTSIIFMPIALKVFAKPHAHTPLVTSSTNDVATQTMDKKPFSRQWRGFSRYQHNCSAIFANERVSGFATICDISQKGCRLRSKLNVRPGDSGQILVDVPGFQALMTISHGVVRWVRGSESGIEFIAIQDEERFLQWLAEIAQGTEIRPTREYSAISTANT